MSRKFLRVVAIGVVLTAGAGVGLGVASAGAQEDPFAPDSSTTTPTTAELLQYGWWNKAQQSPAGGTPVAAPPGAPSDGIFVAYEPTAGPVPAPTAGIPGLIPAVPAPAPNPVVLGPEAFGAVRYSVPQGAEATLTLHFVPTSTTQPGGVNADAGTLTACPVSTTWDPVQNGRYAAAPKYDCTIGVVGAFAGDSVTFTLPASLAPEGQFDLALVPSGTQPYKLSVNAPDGSSLALTSVPESDTASEGEFDPGGFEDPAATFDATSDEFGVDDFGSASAGDFSSGDFSSGGGAGGAAGRGVPSRSVGTQVAVPAGAIGNPFRPDASRGERLMAVALLLALAVGLWWVGGQPVRAPRLLGSLGAGIPVETAEVKTGGIGRFARVRPSTRAPRLF